ncbi:nitroreductase family protein [Actinomadura yumaensis]|uniref:nitroreductase family protein n=1 Tax=Actinomadura TaxID=1988 RepID=UPI002814B59B|nr:nitroreductase family protein [Actinomadura sp. J1-007]
MRIIQTRSVVREYTDQPITDADVQALLTATAAAPTASNRQAWAFIAVREPQLLLSVRAFAPGVIGTPALLLIACLDHSRYADNEARRREGQLCVAMAVQNFLLAAHTLGLGACPASSFLPDPIRLLLDMPDHLQPVLLAAAGHPAHTPHPSPAATSTR